MRSRLIPSMTRRPSNSRMVDVAWLTGAKSHWPGDETSGVLRDVISGYDATLTGWSGQRRAPTGAPGAPVGVMFTTGYGQTGDYHRFAGTVPFSAAALVRQLGPLTTNGIMLHRSGVASEGRWALYSAIASNTILGHRASGAHPNVDYIQAYAGSAAAGTYVYAMTYNGSTVTLYRNGHPFASGASSRSIVDDAGVVRLYVLQVAGSVGAAWTVWDRCLTPSEVRLFSDSAGLTST